MFWHEKRPLKTHPTGCTTSLSQSRSNLCRLESSAGLYYAFLKKSGKQFRRSLKRNWPTARVRAAVKKTAGTRPNDFAESVMG
jgi:hypothetical protein